MHAPTDKDVDLPTSVADRVPAVSTSEKGATPREDQKRFVSLRGHTTNLSEGRYVFVGDSPDTDADGVFICFKNKEGEENHIRLSEEAADALAELLQHRKVQVVTRWVVSLTDGGTKITEDR